MRQLRKRVRPVRIRRPKHSCSHCTFVNNCVGMRNVKWFVTFVWLSYFFCKYLMIEQWRRLLLDRNDHLVLLASDRRYGRRGAHLHVSWIVLLGCAVLRFWPQKIVTSRVLICSFFNLKRNVILIHLGFALKLGASINLIGFTQLYPNPFPVFFLFLPVVTLFM